MAGNGGDVAGVPRLRGWSLPALTAQPAGSDRASALDRVAHRPVPVTIPEGRGEGPGRFKRKVGVKGGTGFDNE